MFNEIIIGKEATNNLATQPRNVTLKLFKKKEFLKLAKSTLKVHPIHKKCKKIFGSDAEKFAKESNTKEHLLQINDIYSNYSFNYDKMALFKHVMLGEGSIIPQYLEVECMLYHGAEFICTPVTSKRVYFKS